MATDKIAFICAENFTQDGVFEFETISTKRAKALIGNTKEFPCHCTIADSFDFDIASEISGAWLEYQDSGSVLAAGESALRLHIEPIPIHNPPSMKDLPCRWQIVRRVL